MQTSAGLLFIFLGLGPAALEVEVTPVAAASRDSRRQVRGDKRQREEHALRLSHAGRYAEAALEFEALWRDFSEVRFLYNAASSRFTVGHYAHAADYLARYLGSPGLSADDRSDAAGQLAEAKRHLVAVTVRVEGPKSLTDATLTVEHVPDLASDLRPELALTPQLAAKGWTATIGLDSGTWRARLELPGYRPVDAEVAVQPGQTFDVVLRPELASEKPQDGWRRPFALGFGIGGGVVALAGIGLTAAESIRGEGLITSDPPCRGSTTQCIDAISMSLIGRAWGGGLLGLGVGAAIGGATAAMPNERRRRLFWIAEASTGSVLALVGAVSLGVGARTLQGTPAPTSGSEMAPWAMDYDAAGRRGAAIHTTGGALLGLGLGLGGSALTGLLLTRHMSKSSASKNIAISPTLGGLVLRGRF